MLSKKIVLIISIFSSLFVSKQLFCSNSEDKDASAPHPRSPYIGIRKKQIPQKPIIAPQQSPTPRSFTLTEEDLRGEVIHIQERRLSIDKARIQSTISNLVKVSHVNKIAQSIDDDSSVTSGFWVQEGPFCTAVTGEHLSQELKNITSSRLAYLLSNGALLHIEKKKDESSEQAPQFSISLVAKSEKTCPAMD